MDNIFLIFFDIIKSLFFNMGDIFTKISSIISGLVKVIVTLVTNIINFILGFFGV